MSGPSVESVCKHWGAKPFFKSEAEAERFRQTFRLECLIALNSGPSASRVGTLPSGRYTAEIASLYDCIKEFYPDYKLPEKSVEELKPFLVGPYSKVLAA